MIREKFGLNEEDGKLMAKVARRSHQINAVYTWEKFQAMGYLWTMIPVINKMYDTEEERIAGYKRHYELFNTNPVVGGFITGLNTAMEMQAAKDKEFDKASIAAVRTSLMGPFAGIGDSISKYMACDYHGNRLKSCQGWQYSGSHCILSLI